jgi:opacity protein-like surface antigen
MTNSTAKLYDNNYATVPAGGLQQLGEGFTGGTSWGLGAGYQFNNWFRADITGEYRSRVGFTGTDIATFPGATFSDVYQGGYSSWVGLVNVYADLGTWWCITPFIGAGVGVANIQTTGLQDSGSNLTGGVLAGGASYFANGASTTNLAWAVHAGLAYHVNRNFTVELAYRYLDMGTANHGFGSSFDGSNAGPSSFQFRDLTSQDLRIGVRWTCCDVEPPPPLIRKG